MLITFQMLLHYFNKICCPSIILVIKVDVKVLEFKIVKNSSIAPYMHLTNDILVFQKFIGILGIRFPFQINYSLNS